MINLTVVIIAKNEEKMIIDCLESVKKLADEIIVIDNGSIDQTIEIAEKYGARIFKINGTDFSRLRNEGLKEARGEWILYVDADERVTPELKDEILKYIKDDPSASSGSSAFGLRRKNFYLGNHEWPKIEKLERLFKKEKLKGWYGDLHESPKFEGNLRELNGFLLHYTHRDLSSMLAKTIEWSSLEAQARFKAGHPRMALWRFPRVMLSAFYDSYIRDGGWKVGIVGLIESLYQAFSSFITYAKLWELQNSTVLRRTVENTHEIS